MKLIEALD